MMNLIPQKKLHWLIVALFYLFSFQIQVHKVCGQALEKSIRYSPSTLIYKISNAQAAILYQNIAGADSTFFTRLFTSFPTGSALGDSLPVGHYLFVKAEQGDISYTLKSVNNLYINLLNNYRDLVFTCSDMSGNEPAEIEVSVGSKRVKYDLQTKTYRLPKSNKQGLVKACYQGHCSFLSVRRKYNNTFIRRTTRKIATTFPVNHLISPFFYVRNNIRNAIKYNFRHMYPPGLYTRVKRLVAPNEKRYYGYMAFNKPVYKPGDTVKLKAYVADSKGKPLNSKARFLISYYDDGNNYKRVEQVLGTVVPKYKGSYVYEFVLGDSLKLKIDKKYDVTLDDGKKESEFSYAHGRFRLANYELKSNFFSVRYDNEPKHKPATLYLKGTDDNNMPLYDVKATIVVLNQSVDSIGSNRVFLPDTLWKHVLALDPVQETRIVLPDSVFPPAQLKCRVDVTFSNAENEQHVKQVNFDYQPFIFPLELNLKNDSLIVNFISGKKAANKKATLTATRDGHKTASVISLPYRAKANRFFEKYTLAYDGKEKTFNPEIFKSNVGVDTRCTADSVLVTIQNPGNIPLKYYLFKGNKLLQYGEGINCRIQRKAFGGAKYFLSVQYVWNGNSVSEEYTLTPDQAQLTLAIKSPDMVYPGQKVDFTIEVKDGLGRPVKDADLTAYAATKKFEHEHATMSPNPTNPYRPDKKGREVFNQFNISKNNPSDFYGRLMWRNWHARLGLDSITFYKFLFPWNGLFTDTRPAEDSITQVAPFITDKGQVLQTHVVYIDNIPVYYSGVGTVEPYSFRISPGWEYKIQIRTARALVTLPDIYPKKGHKMIISADLSHLPGNATKQEMSDKFTDKEIYELKKYFMVMDDVEWTGAYIEQDSTYRIFQPFTWNNHVLTGPMYIGRARYTAYYNYTTLFQFEPYYSYQFKANLLKMKEHQGFYNFFSTTLNQRSSVYPFSDKVFTARSVARYLNEQKPRPRYWPDKPNLKVPIGISKSDKVGRLWFEAKNNLAPLNFIYLINLDNPDEYFVFPDEAGLKFNLFNEGKYNAVFVYGNMSYTVLDSVLVRPNGISFYRVKQDRIRPADSFSRKIFKQVSNWSQGYYEGYQEKDIEQIRRLYYEHINNRMGIGPLVTGRVVDKSGEPISFVQVVVKGTTVYTLTDVNGHFAIHCPIGEELLFSFISYITKSFHYIGQRDIEIVLEEDVKRLEEVVVIGYGATKRTNLSSAQVSVIRNIGFPMQARVAGVAVGGAPGAGITVNIRGTSTLGSNPDALYIIDGNPGNFKDIDPQDVESMEILQGKEAVALYGTRAANGVVVVRTKSGLVRQAKANTTLVAGGYYGTGLRSNFRDYAFWQPLLRTNAEGKATFSATFPDDITGWNTYVIGMDNKGRSAKTEAFLPSYKPVVAQMLLPHFLTEGDTALCLGRITSYLDDSIRLKRSISIGGMQLENREITLAHSHIDTLRLAPSATDSVALRYTIEREGYEDGEKKSLPVYKAGVMETKGIFLALERDTSLVLAPEKGKRHIYAQADMLDVLLDEIRHVKYYQYDCNEQMTSKLVALLLEKKVAAFRNKQFEGDGDIEKITKKLVTNRAADGSWSWWGNSGHNTWISLYAASTLEVAQKAGCKIPYNKDATVDYCLKNLANLTSYEKTGAFIFLVENGVKVIVKEHVDSLMKSRSASVYEKIKVQYLLQATGAVPDWAWLHGLREQTMKGNYYWGSEADRLFDNAVSATLLVYKMIEKENPKDRQLSSIRAFFLERRKANWRNTYESAQILQTILPFYMQGERKQTPTILHIKGKKEMKVSTFPFETELDATDSVLIEKTGTNPVYFMAATTSFEPKPPPVAKSFVVKTSFEGNAAHLKAGQPVVLLVEVEVKNAAEYLMIEVPIPAGCSYKDKNTSWNNGEVHREYYYHKTNIYCQYLPKGRYTYRLSLLPRFTGKYVLNPAVISCMYFPVLFGREGMKKVDIK